MKLRNFYFDKLKSFTIYLVDYKRNFTKICTYFSVPSLFILQNIIDYYSEVNSEFIVKVFDFHNNYLFCSLESFMDCYFYKDCVRGQDYEF